jgi:D-serine deaminase-like pyridoxal phosphate-dependent protein
MDITDLPSPALVVDLATFDANVAAIDQLFRGTSKRIRPHVKTHRTPALALRQLTSATDGLTCATVGEAEVVVAAGATDVLIANEVVDRGKLQRVAALARGASICVAVDDAGSAQALGAAARAAGSTVAVLVDIDVGLGRCGVPGAAEAVALGTVAERTPGLRLAGIMGYEGRRRAAAQSRADGIQRAYTTLAETADAFRRASLAVETVSSAGTSTLHEALADPVITEVQAGTYALMEADLDGLDLPFRPALTVVATVISRNGDRAVLDSGRKSIAGDYGEPEPMVTGAKVTGFNEEHTVLDFAGSGSGPPALGERVALRPAHVRLTFNLHDSVWLAHSDRSFEEVRVAARGRSA